MPENYKTPNNEASYASQQVISQGQIPTEIKGKVEHQISRILQEGLGWVNITPKYFNSGGGTYVSEDQILFTEERERFELYGVYDKDGNYGVGFYYRTHQVGKLIPDELLDELLDELPDDLAFEVFFNPSTPRKYESDPNFLYIEISVASQNESMLERIVEPAKLVLGGFFDESEGHPPYRLFHDERSYILQNVLRVANIPIDFKEDFESTLDGILAKELGWINVTPENQYGKNYKTYLIKDMQGNYSVGFVHRSELEGGLVHFPDGTELQTEDELNIEISLASPTEAMAQIIKETVKQGLDWFLDEFLQKAFIQFDGDWDSIFPPHMKIYWNREPFSIKGEERTNTLFYF
ncbi:MAG: hypothetical protein IH934_06500 [Nanoarchaeota archaeon]|nr:hypothetical protein [Nanoarchaeota archaeon]